MREKMRHVYTSLILLFVIFGCSREIMRDSAIQTFTSFTATISDSTKVHIGSSGSVKWDNKDVICVFSDKQAEAQSFTRSSSGGAFIGNAVSGTQFYAYFPKEITQKSGNNMILNVPAQIVVFNSNRVSLPMVAKSTGNSLSFNQTSGVLHFHIQGEGDYSTIRLYGNSGEMINGPGTIDLAKSTPLLTLSGQSASDQIVSEIPSDISLANGFDVYFILPVMSFGMGFTLELSGSSGVLSKSTTKIVNLSAGMMVKYQWTVEKSNSSGIKKPEMVDLGLPSGVKWASFNIGADTPEGLGNYYAWGETEPKEDYSWDNYKWYDGSKFTKYYYYSPSWELSYSDGRTELEPADDVAYSLFGGKWRMPVADDMKELFDESNCTVTRTSRNSVAGYDFKSTRNGKSIFIPCSGYRSGVDLVSDYPDFCLWLSQLGYDLDYSSRAALCISNCYMPYDISFQDRDFGMQVRPVYGDKTVPVSSVSVLPANLSLKTGEIYKLTYSVYPPTHTDTRVELSSSNPSVVEVTDYGLAVGIKSGTATITVKSVSNGKSATCKVTISQATVTTPDAVDLGLPSGIKWASFNLGADSPEKPGHYYAWGETELKADFSEESYKWSLGTSHFHEVSKYNTDSSYGTVDNLITLLPEDDAAHIKLGGNWRMPTKEECEELLSNCYWSDATYNGKKCYSLTSRVNGNSIIIPKSGRISKGYYSANGSYIWSSYLSQSPLNAYAIHGANGIYSTSREDGLNIRPVWESDYTAVTGVALDKSSLSLIRGESAKLTATVSPSGATNKSVTWNSSNTSVATVSENGSVTAVKAGTATITVRTEDGGKTATCQVSITNYATPQAVDLGLPSGVKWGSFNLGATSPEGQGDWFAWGEVEPKNNYSWSNYKWMNGGNELSPHITKYCDYPTNGDNGFADYKTILDLSDDAAYANLGGNWRMPTKADIEELLDNCSVEPYTLNGVKVCKLISKHNGNVVYFPGRTTSNSSENASIASSNLVKHVYVSNGKSEYFYKGYFDYNGSSSYGSVLGAYRVFKLHVRPVCKEYIPISQVILSANNVIIHRSQGSTFKLVATPIPSNATDPSILWTCENDNNNLPSATVDQNGLITASYSGTATIRAYTSNGNYATCRITVD